jgi:hypothetical protein
MLRATHALLPLLFLTGCPESASKDAPSSSASAAAAKSSSSVTVTTASVTTASAASSATGVGLKPGSAMANGSAGATAVASASAAPTGSAAKAGACAALEWDKDRMGAKATTFKGKIGNGEGENGRAETEKFQTLVFEKPMCGPDHSPVDEAQLYTSDKTIDLKKMVGKSVTIEGEPFSAHTAHHHRPIVVEVKKLTAN